jgi:hypothetical protein
MREAHHDRKEKLPLCHAEYVGMLEGELNPRWYFPPDVRLCALSRDQRRPMAG